MKSTEQQTLFVALAFVASAFLVSACGGAPASAAPPSQQPTPSDAKASDTKASDTKPASTSDTKPTPVSNEAGYTIKIERPRKVGFKYKLHSVGKRDLKVTANGKTAPGSQVMSWMYDATVIVKAVDGLGRPTAEEHTIAMLEVTVDGKKSSAATAGTVVLATMTNGKESFTVAGAPAGKLIAGTLSEIVDLEKQGAPSKDVLFGTTGKKNVGDSWSANVPELVASFSKDMTNAPMPLKVENTTARVTIVGAKEIAGIKGLSYRMVITMKNVAPKMGPVVPTKGSLIASLDVWMPVDITSRALQHDTKKMVMHVEGTAGPAAIVVDMVQEATSTKTAIK